MTDISDMLDPDATENLLFRKLRDEMILLLPASRFLKLQWEDGDETICRARVDGGHYFTFGRLDAPHWLAHRYHEATDDSEEIGSWAFDSLIEAFAACEQHYRSELIRSSG